MAEAFLRALAGGKFDVMSTAVNSDSLNPLMKDVMKEAEIDVSQQASRSVAESLKESFSCVITICDARRERHPIFPFTTRLVHWSIAAPASVEGSLEESRERLRHLRDEIKRQVSQFVAEGGSADEGAVLNAEQRARAATANGASQEEN